MTKIQAILAMILLSPVAQASDLHCYRKPLNNGRIGETVLVCEAQPVKAEARKPGVTVIIARLGKR